MFLVANILIELFQNIRAAAARLLCFKNAFVVFPGPNSLEI